MSNVPPHTAESDTGAAARRFFAIQDLLATPDLARFYTDLLVNSPTTVPATRERLGISKSTAYKYADELEALGVAEELEQHENGSNLWRAEPVSGVWHGDVTVAIGPIVIAVYGATSVVDDLELFLDRHGKAAIAPAVFETISYLKGNTTRRGVARALGVPAVEGIAVSQAIEGIIGVVQNVDPSLKAVSFAVATSDRAIEHAPYQRVDG